MAMRLRNWQGLFAFAWSLLLWLGGLASAPGASANLTFNGAQTNQYIDGFGVNANYFDWDTNGLASTLTALKDDAGVSLYRVIFNYGWETTNDNSDPAVMDWTYYNSMYSGPEFQKLWGLMRHLNQSGITNGL